MGLVTHDGPPSSDDHANVIGPEGKIIQVKTIAGGIRGGREDDLPELETRRRGYESDGDPGPVNIDLLERWTDEERREIEQGLAEVSFPLESKPPASPVRRSMLLSAAAWLMPGQEREGWLEENRAYLTDIDGRLGRIVWVLSQLVALPRLSYTFRTDAKKESA